MKSKLYTRSSHGDVPYCRVCGAAMRLVHADVAINQGKWECGNCGKSTKVGPLSRERTNVMLGAGRRVLRWV